MPWDEALAHAVVRETEEKPAPETPLPYKEPAAARGAPPEKKRGFFGALRRS
jgi:hypothetical protein